MAHFAPNPCVDCSGGSRADGGLVSQATVASAASHLLSGRVFRLVWRLAKGILKGDKCLESATLLSFSRQSPVQSGAPRRQRRAAPPNSATNSTQIKRTR